MENKKVKAIIGGTKIVSGFGVTCMVANLCGALVAPEAKVVTKVASAVGTLGIQGAVNMQVDKYWDSVGNAVEEQVNKIKEVVKAAKEEAEKVEEVKEEKPKKKETKKKSKKSSKKSEIEVIEVQVAGDSPLAKKFKEEAMEA